MARIARSQILTFGCNEHPVMTDEGDMKDHLVTAEYLTKGLTCMSRVGRKNLWLEAHHGAACIAAYFFCRENRLDARTQAAISRLLDDAISRNRQIFEPYPPESCDRNGVAKILERLRRNIEQLRKQGHDVIYAMHALKALREAPDLGTPSIISGICSLMDFIHGTEPHPENTYNTKHLLPSYGTEVQIIRENLSEEHSGVILIRQENFGGLVSDKKLDLIAAFSNKQPRLAVPIWELEFHLWKQFSSRPVIVGTEFLNLSPAEQKHALHVNAEVIVSVAEALNFSAVTVPGSYWEEAPGQPAYYWLPDEARYEQIRILSRFKSENLMLVAGSGGVLAMPAADEYLEFSINLFEKPEEIESRARTCLSSGLENAKRLIDLGIEAVYTASDIADNHGPFFNPDQMRRFILPYLKDWASKVKAMGAFGILHSDGNLTPYLDDIADSGVHALQAIDPVAGMSMTTTKNQVEGRLCLCGNIDCGLLLTGSPDLVHQVTKSLLEENKSGGGLVLGASNALQRQTPKANYLAMIDAWRMFGRYDSRESPE